MPFVLYVTEDDDKPFRPRNAVQEDRPNLFLSNTALARQQKGREVRLIPAGKLFAHDISRVHRHGVPCVLQKSTFKRLTALHTLIHKGNEVTLALEQLAPHLVVSRAGLCRYNVR